VKDVPEEGIRQHRFETPSGATTILVVRHGESQPEHPDRPFPRADGHSDPPLDPVGVKQAELLADRLQDERIDAIYVTTLQRTHETAAPLATRLGITPIVEPDLREVFLGEWEGSFRRRAVSGDPLFHQIFVEERWDVVPGAESHDEFDERVWRGFQRIVTAHPDRHLLHRVTGARRFAFSTTENASISEIVATPDRILLRRYNDVAHLLPLLQES
jgi:2,3-bisphosphoglycerate-dependent phosphoglycerate mutase